MEGISPKSLRSNFLIESYIRNVEKYKLDQDAKKYNIVLNFINELLNLKDDDKLKSLREFRKIKEDNLCKNKSHNFEIIKKYCKEFKSKLELTIKLNKKDEEDDDKNSGYVISVIERVLRSINYKLISMKYSSGRYYTIKN